MKKILIATLILSAGAVVNVAGAEILQVGTETSSPPLTYLDVNSGRQVGFDIDLINAVGKKAGFQADVRSMGFDALIPALRTGSIDIMISGVAVTDKRKKVVNFSEPYLRNGYSFMVKTENAASVKTMKDLENKTLCAQLGSEGANVMRAIPGTTVKTFDAPATAYIEIASGGCFGMLYDRAFNAYYLSKEKGKASGLVQVEVQGADKHDYDVAIAVRKEDKKLLTRINNGLAQIKANGTYRQIYEKWFGKAK